MKQVKGELTAWRPRGLSGWGVGTLRTDEGATLAIVGTLPGARAGDAVEAHGSLERDPKWGEQFKVKSATLRAPLSIDGAAAWMAEVLPGIGDARARALIDQVAGGSVTELWRIIEHECDRLTQVTGVSLVMALQIHETYSAEKRDKDDYVQLHAWGLTSSQITQCLVAWDSPRAAVAAIRQNPYRLCEDVRGFGWQRAEVVAARSGISRESPLRVEAGLLHALREHELAGHVYMDTGDFRREARALLALPTSVIMRGVGEALHAGVILERDSVRMYRIATDALESEVARRVRDRIDSA